MQDSTTNAMTEVALGLSMAFFSLLIVALLSISVPKSLPEESKELNADSKNITISKQTKSSSSGPVQFAFYYDGYFYDQNLLPKKISNFDSKQGLVVAVDKKIAFSDVFTLRQQINHPNLSITTLNDEWSARLSHLPARTLD
jgi:hypothetical protein